MSRAGTVPGVEVFVNGRAMEVPEGSTVAAILDGLGLSGRVVVVEHNGEPLARSSVGTAVVGDGDRLEVVRAVAGG